MVKLFQINLILLILLCYSAKVQAFYTIEVNSDYFKGVKDNLVEEPLFEFFFEENEELLLSIKSNSDSTLELALCSITLLKCGGVVEDTFADINGQYFISNINEVHGIVFSYTSYYYTYMSIEDLRMEPSIYLKRSKIIYESGGAEGYIDYELNKEKERIDSLITSWKGVNND